MLLISDARLKALGLSEQTVRLLGPLIRGLLAVVVIGVATRQIITYAEIAETTVSVRRMGDFSVFYESSRRVVEGRGDPYETSAGLDTWPNLSPNLNPPPFVLLMTPLAFWRPLTAFSMWTTLSVASALLAVGIIFKELSVRVTLTTVTWTLVALSSAAATGALLLTAQVSWLLWGPVTLMWAAARRRRWIFAAVLLGLTMSVKPFLGLLVLSLAFNRQWLALVIAAAVALMNLAIGAAVLGLHAFVSWIAAIRSVTWAGHVFNSSVFGLTSRLFADRPLPIWSLQPLFRAPEWIQPIWFMAAAGLFTVTLGKLSERRAMNFEPRVIVDRQFAVLLSAALLMTPLGWVYYHFFLAGPCIALFSRERWRNALHWRPVVLAGALICFAPSPGTLTTGQPDPWATLTVGSAYFWGLLGVWICAVMFDGSGLQASGLRLPAPEV